MKYTIVSNGGVTYEENFRQQRFSKKYTLIAIPIALQNLIISSLNMIDTLMISELGKSSIAAVGLANQLFFLFFNIVWH